MNSAITHDWNLILQEAGEESLAPSAMRHLDSTLDAQTTRDKYLATIQPLTSKYKMSADFTETIDFATMNLIATHLGASVKEYHLTNIFAFARTSSDIRRYVLIAHMEESATGRNTVPRLNSLTKSKDPLLLDYQINTDHGLAAQHGVIRFMLQLWGHGNYDLVQEVLSIEAPLASGWFTDPIMLRYVLTHPEQAEHIADTINERETTDLALIRTIMENATPAVSQGLL